MLSFREVVDECYLGDFGFVGPPFSLKNGQERGDQFGRLDILDWKSLFPSTLGFLYGSDHKAFVLETVVDSRGPKKRKRFLFKPIWLINGEIS